MASKLAVYETGYEDERFERIVSDTLHCIICTNVIKDPVMCQRNEHIFCRACITRHLMNSQKCPTCMELLTVETLTQASRTVMNLLSELKIRCEFFDRGCEKFVQLEDLKRHVADCGFAPAVCSNEGCQLEVNKQDLLHHETTVCELRRVKWEDIRNEMNTVKVDLAAMIENKIEANKNVVVKLMQERQEESNRRFVEDNTRIKTSLDNMSKQLERIIQQAKKEEMKNDVMGIKVIIAGGGKPLSLDSVETFSLTNKTWTLLLPLKEKRLASSSVVHNTQLLVIGGWSSNSIEQLSSNAAHIDGFIPWKNGPVKLPAKIHGHCSLVYNGQLIVTGGYDEEKDEYSDSITEISLVEPDTSKLLATIPQKRCYHGVALFGDKILIVGGRESRWSNSALRSVVMYNITKKECQELTPLPYPVHEMAIVKLGDDNVIIMGGADSYGKPLNKVLMYNIKAQKSHELPDMKYNRRGCVAAVVGDTVIVMGGQDERRNYLKSVEGFRFDRYSWEELPPMHEARWGATVVVC